MAFEAEVNGHRLMLDAGPDVGGKNRGPRPKPLLLVALAGCTGMDVIYILRKMKQEPSWFNLELEGELTDEHPKHYSSIEVVYQFKAADGLDPKKVQRAVTLSQEQYCGVSGQLAWSAEISHRIEYL